MLPKEFQDTFSNKFGNRFYFEKCGDKNQIQHVGAKVQDGFIKEKKEKEKEKQKLKKGKTPMLTWVCRPARVWNNIFYPP